MRLALEQHMLKVQRLNSESGMMVTPATPLASPSRCHRRHAVR
jgi:hypothetical protein